MSGRTQRRKGSDEEAVSSEQVWTAIRYLDPDVQQRAQQVSLLLALLAVSGFLFAISVLLYLHVI